MSLQTNNVKYFASVGYVLSVLQRFYFISKGLLIIVLVVKGGNGFSSDV